MTNKAATFKISGGKTGVLLLHGLGGTPAEMRFVAMGLARQGYTVHCPQLAGNGNRAESNGSSWQDWYNSAVEALDELRQDLENFAEHVDTLHPRRKGPVSNTDLPSTHDIDRLNLPMKVVHIAQVLNGGPP